MKKIKLLSLVVVASFSTLLISCGGEDQHEGSEKEDQGEAIVMTTDSVHTYICPMNCDNSASIQEGPCPLCGMDLKSNPNYNGQPEEEVMDGSMESEDASAEEVDHEEEHDHDGHDHDGHDHG